MKRLRLTLLVFTLFAVLFVFYYKRVNTVRVETVLLQSKATGKALPYQIVLPRGYGWLPDWRLHYPVLYLLHGHGGNYSSWTSRTDLTQYVSDLQMIVVTPEGENGWYTDSATQEADKYESFIVKELIPDVESRFRVIPDRGGRAIAGNSMGGYGALKFGLKYPAMFAFAGSMSGAFDAPLRTDDSSIMRTFGLKDNPVRDANNLSKLANKVTSASAPYLYFDCGKDDPWLTTNRDLALGLDRLGIRHDYREMSGGHDWPYWNQRLNDVLQLAAKTTSQPRN